MTPRAPFRFKQFSLDDSRSAMKLSTDAVLLGAFTRLGSPACILDIGTGSGIVALMLAQRCNARILGIDVDTGSIADAAGNFARSPWKERLSARHQSLQDLALSERNIFDVIVCNPPYFENSQRSPHPARNLSKHNDLLPLTDLVKGMAGLLTGEGTSSLIIPAHRAPVLTAEAAGAGLILTRKLMVRPKPGKDHNRVLLEYGRRGERPEQGTLTIRNTDNSFTEEYREFTRDFYLGF